MKIIIINKIKKNLKFCNKEIFFQQFINFFLNIMVFKIVCQKYFDIVNKYLMNKYGYNIVYFYKWDIGVCLIIKKKKYCKIRIS